MSLILDALKKSEAERNRGMPPSLHAHFSAPRRARRAPWVAGAGAVLLVAGLTGSWMWMSRPRADLAPNSPDSMLAKSQNPAPLPVEGSATAPVDTSVPVAETPAFASTPSSTLPVGHESSALGGVSGNGEGGSVSGGGLPVPQRAVLFTPSATPTPQVAETPVAPPPVAAPVTPPPAPEPVAVDPNVIAADSSGTATPSATPDSPSAPNMSPDNVAQAPTVAPEAVAKPEEVLPNVFQLPYTTRKDLPKLALSMHVYSPIPAERFIVLNGKRFTLETPAPGPELTLLDIVADGAVLEFRGTRFLLPRQTY